VKKVRMCGAYFSSALEGRGFGGRGVSGGRGDDAAEDREEGVHLRGILLYSSGGRGEGGGGCQGGGGMMS
jgi:hypothetical protein